MVIPEAQPILKDITASSCGSIRPGFVEDGLTEGVSEAEAAVERELIQKKEDGVIARVEQGAGLHGRAPVSGSSVESKMVPGPRICLDFVIYQVI